MMLTPKKEKQFVPRGVDCESICATDATIDKIVDEIGEVRNEHPDVAQVNIRAQKDAKMFAGVKKCPCMTDESAPMPCNCAGTECHRIRLCREISYKLRTKFHGEQNAKVYVSYDKKDDENILISCVFSKSVSPVEFKNQEAPKASAGEDASAENTPKKRVGGIVKQFKKVPQNAASTPPSQTLISNLKREAPLAPKKTRRQENESSYEKFTPRNLAEEWSDDASSEETLLLMEKKVKAELAKAAALEEKIKLKKREIAVKKAVEEERKKIALEKEEKEIREEARRIVREEEQKKLKASRRK